MTFSIAYHAPDGSQLRAEIGAQETLLDAAHLAGVAVDATCGGRGRCRSCRVKILWQQQRPVCSIQWRQQRLLVSRQLRLVCLE